MKVQHRKTIVEIIQNRILTMSEKKPEFNAVRGSVYRGRAAL